MNDEKQKNFILNAPLRKVIFSLSWPAVLAMLLLGGNNLLDAFFVSHFAQEGALAGISVALPPLFTIIGLGVLVGSGAGTLLSITIGAEDKKAQKNILGNVNLVVLLMSGLVMLIGLLFSKSILFLMGGRDKILLLGNDYFRILLWATPLWIYTIAVNNLIRAEGKMKLSALIMGIGLLLNGICNYLFMVVFQFGIKGAAWGTNIGMLAQVIIVFFYFAKKNSFSIGSFWGIRFDKIIFSKIFSMGFAGFIMQFMATIQFLLVLNVLNHYGGASDIAFFGMISRLFGAIIQPIGGFMFALTPVIGINFGAGRVDRVISAYKQFILFALALLFPFWIFFLAFPQTVISLFMNNPLLEGNEIFYFRIYMALLPIIPYTFLSIAFFPAINKGKISSILGILQQVVFYIPMMIILPLFVGVAGVYYGTFLIEILSVIPVIILIVREFYLLRQGFTKWDKALE